MKLPFPLLRPNRPAASKPATSKIDPIDAALTYHEETKHHYHRFARSLGYLDWDTQPNPFRHFAGSPVFELPRLPMKDQPEPAALTLESLSRFFRNSLAVSAWKRYGSARWALRVNPSSGNLHPTEGYAILPQISPDFPCGVYHYRPSEHSLERRATLQPALFTDLLSGFPPETFLVGLTSIHWREAWKYGERAYRYCQHDTGHALAAFAISASIFGWKLIVLEELADSEIATLLGLNRASDFEEAEDEDPDLIAAVIPSDATIPTETTLLPDVILRMDEGQWHGKANRLSESHVEWEIIQQVSSFSVKQRTEPRSTSGSAAAPAPPVSESILQQRRSAVALDGSTSISAEVFYGMLARTLPENNSTFFHMLQRSVLNSPRIHLGLFVHRVEGVNPGLYFFVRDPMKLKELQGATHPAFEWMQPEGCPSNLPLYRLREGDVQRLSAGVSCSQEIAGDGAFSLGMIAEFETPIRETGAWLYRRLFWESGIVGQFLYLEAEAAGIRGTGIGCFFDDPVHETFGFKGAQFQSLYHFTMGGPVEDTRLTTEPAYPVAEKA